MTSLLMHFPSNFGAETTKIYYIGLRGEFTQVGGKQTMSCRRAHTHTHTHTHTHALTHTVTHTSHSQAHRHGVTIATYEARANPANHKTSDYNPVSDFVS